MNLHTNTARAVRAGFDYDAAYDAAVEKITAGLLDGQSVKCGPFTASLADCAEYAYTRAETDAKFAELVTGKISAEQFKTWALLKLNGYACDMAVYLADDMLSCEIDYAEYMEGDR